MVSAAELERALFMDAQRYDVAKRSLNCKNLSIQTGIDDSDVDSNPNTPPKLETFLMILAARTESFNTSSSVSTEGSDSSSDACESTSTPPSSVATEEKEQLLANDFLDEQDDPCKVQFDRRTRSPLSFFSRPSSPVSRPTSPISAAFGALTLNCLNATSAFEREVDYLQAKRAREDRGSATLQVGVDDTTDKHNSRLFSREKEDDKNGPRLELERRLLLEPDAGLA
ncbi:hypothetical protein C8F01DRAFT_1362149 [Mycena amicta]|nr:hypothetical protein C8F01DRAFT_1362149 [Mycena amicta]